MFVFCMKKFMKVSAALASICMKQANIIYLSADDVVCYRINISTLSKNFQYDLQEVPYYLYNAKLKRLHEFFAGRILAEAILKQHFNCSIPITSMQLKLPQWPQGLKGCISHSNQWVVVAISSQAKYLGIDLEHIVNMNFAKESIPLILTQFEQMLWWMGKVRPLNFYAYITLIFSLKESLYKAVYPVVQNYIDFLEVTVVKVDVGSQMAILKFDQDIQERYSLNAEYEGFWRFCDGYVFTWVVINC
ncbi:hypothetical protein F904_00002 [Acinetobacter dispersus]|uniref:Enterobactin synthase component D n=2 Tax=Acinetobacter dispersus TaxID=70348 RepID=N9N545_9GAMM|nr:hypothetical protein F904_00002 [Acinetobacter dispersus]